MKKRLKAIFVAGVISLSMLATVPVSAATFKLGNWFSAWDRWKNIFYQYQIEEEEITEASETITAELSVNNITNRTRTIQITWNDISCDHYEVQCSTRSDFDGAESKTTQNNNYTYYTGSPSFWHYPAHQTYYLRVRAVSGRSFGEWSNTVVAEGD